MTELASALCSITPTQRRRFFWAVWFDAPPRHSPFLKPDASHGGATSFEDALRDAARATGRHLTLIDPYWARAWNRVLRGEAPPPLPERPEARAERARARAAVTHASVNLPSAWSVLGLDPGATAEEVKRAYRKRALETHPDAGGDPADFLAVRSAYERLADRAARPKPRAPRE